MPHPFRLGLIIGGLLALAACDQTMQRPQEGGPGRGPALIQSEAPVSQPPQPVAPPLLARQELDQGRLAGGRPPASAPATRDGSAAKLAAPSSNLIALRPPSAEVNRDKFGVIDDNPVHSTQEQPISTFSIDVDRGAYALVRRFLRQGQLPPKDAVRVEELINYFDYAYAPPKQREPPFSLITEIGPTPWNPGSHLLHIGIKGFMVPRDQRPAANLVFLIDVSGSMNSPDKLPLLKSAFKLLVNQLEPRDRVAMVVYAGASGVVLEPTPGDEKGRMVAALEQLSAGGSTHGSAGIQLAYAMAEQGRIPGGINRVILATDGDFNVGTVNHEQLIDLIEKQRAGGIGLTTLGFGQGNYNDRLMEQLADKGDGHYAYIDNLQEANKVLVEELSSTLETIARDVKIQIEFNPARVAEYRLIGYENRRLAREDFSNDKVDAGDIGSGHSVTALYEISLRGGDRTRLEPRRYAQPQGKGGDSLGDELAFLRLRYKAPSGDAPSRLSERPIHWSEAHRTLAETSDDYRFAAAVAGFGQLLRGGRYTEGFKYEDVAELARGASRQDPFGYRGEFLGLVQLAKGLDRRPGD